ncbi:hypothetical protein [Geopseudomonas aromaticivorans]
MRVTHVASGLSLAYGAGRSEAENRQRAKAALTHVLDTLTQNEGERHLLEDSLGQALALVVLIADATKSPLAGLLEPAQRKALANVINDVARALPYFDAQGIWEGIAELFGQLVDVATGGTQEPLRAVLMERLPSDAEANVSAGEKSRELLRLLAGGEMGKLLEGVGASESIIPATPEEIVAALASADAEAIKQLLISRLPVGEMWPARLAELLAVAVTAGVEDRDQRGVPLTPERLAEMMSLADLDEIANGTRYSKTARAEAAALLKAIPGYEKWKVTQTSTALQSAQENLGYLQMQFVPTLRALQAVELFDALIEQDEAVAAGPVAVEPDATAEPAVAAEAEVFEEVPGFGEPEIEVVAVAVADIPLPPAAAPEVAAIAESLLADLPPIPGVDEPEAVVDDDLPQIPDVPEFGFGDDEGAVEAEFQAEPALDDEEDEDYVEHGFGFGDAPVAKGGDDDDDEEGGSGDGAIDQALTPSKGNTNATNEIPEFTF